MARRCSRRQFLKRSAFLAGAAGVAWGPTILAADAPNKVGVGLIGCGGRGRGAHSPGMARQRLVALVDPDERQSAATLNHLQNNAKKFGIEGADLTKIKVFTDYRKLFDDMPKDLDAVVIATPDHQHTCPAMMAIQNGKHVFCEKPLTRYIGEARKLGEAARKAPKVATQMGNQGLGTGGDQALAEYLQAGAIGAVTEVHSWHCWGDRFGGSFPRPPAEPIPQGLHWDDWIGPAPYRDFHKRCHPGYWHGWLDFGTGSLGGWGTHLWDATDYALKLGFPTSVEAVRMEDASDERFPMLTTLCYDFPARGDRPALKYFWYEGSHVKGKSVGPEGDNDDVGGINRPKLAAEIEKEHGRKLGGVGTLIVGEKGIIHVGSHGGGPRIIPEEKHKAFPAPARTLPRISGGIWTDWLRACTEGGAPPISNFADFAGPLLEAMYVGHLAMRAGIGKKVEWDGPAMKCTNLPDLNRFVGPPYRKGWSL